MLAVGYTRVSTGEQGDSGLGLEAQRDAIRAECERRGWKLVDIYEDVASGGSTRKRPELARALQAVATQEADVLVVSKLDRLTRSMLDFAQIMEQARKEGWALVVIDLAVDMTTPNGALIAGIMSVLAEWERQIISERTKSALAVARKRGVRLGRKPGVSEETKNLIRFMRREGRSWREVAEGLTKAGIPTAQGGVWHASTVRRLVTPK